MRARLESWGAESEAHAGLVRHLRHALAPPAEAAAFSLRNDLASLRRTLARVSVKRSAAARVRRAQVAVGGRRLLSGRAIKWLWGAWFWGA